MYETNRRYHLCEEKKVYPKEGVIVCICLIYNAKEKMTFRIETRIAADSLPNKQSLNWMQQLFL